MSAQRIVGDRSVFCGRLNPENRWIKMVDLVPWEEVESEYARHFKSHGRGEVALNVRIALGTLLIKEILGLSDREAVESVIENPYFQFQERKKIPGQFCWMRPVCRQTSSIRRI